MFLFLVGISVDPPSLFGQPLRRRLLELLALEVGRRRPVFRDGAGLVEAKRFRDGEPKRVEHHLRRDSPYPAAPQPLVAVVPLLDAERPFDLDAPIDPKLYALWGEEVPFGLRLHPQERDVGFEGLCVGAYVGGVSVIVSLKRLDHSYEIVGVGPRLRDRIGGDDSGEDQILDVVRGVHVGAEAGIVVGLKAHRGGVAVGRVIRLPPLAAYRLLLLVLGDLEERRGYYAREPGFAPRRGLRQRPAYGFGTDEVLIAESGQEPPFPAKREERSGEPAVERGRLPHELVFVRVGLEFAAVGEGVVEGQPPFSLQKMNMRYYVSNGIQESDITRLETD